MSLFFQELKKIWRPGLLAALALLGGIYYYMFPLFYVEEHFCNGPNASEFDLAVGWVEKYGPTMEPEERAELDGQLAEEIEKFDAQIAAMPDAAQAGMTDYETFAAAWRSDHMDENGQRDMDLVRLIYKIMDNTNYYTVKDLENYMANYDWHSEAAQDPWSDRLDECGPERKARVRELEQGGRGFLPHDVVYSTSEYAKDLAVWIVLSAVLLLSPTLVRDRLHRMRQTQWSSRRGRRVLSVQLAAGMASALALSVLNTVLYAVPFLAQGPLALARCPLFNWSMGIYTWFDGTYGAYLAALVLLLLTLGVSAGAVTMFLSQFSGNYIAMLLKAVPLFAVLGPILGSWLLDMTFWFRPLYENADIDLPEGAEAVCAAVLAALCAALLLWTAQRQKRRELVS